MAVAAVDKFILSINHIGGGVNRGGGTHAPLMDRPALPATQKDFAAPIQAGVYDDFPLGPQV